MNSKMTHHRIPQICAGLALLFTSIFPTASFASKLAMKRLLRDCYSPVLNEPARKMTVNGHVLNEIESKHIQWYGRCVFPFLPGTRDEQATSAARASWWALREGNLEKPGEDVFRYSNCHTSNGDKTRSDIWNFNCKSNIWQVGIAAGQVANYSDDEYKEATDKVRDALGTEITEADLLAWSATLAGFEAPKRNDPDLEKKKAVYLGIVRSTGRIRKSWLLRNPLIGTLLVQDLEVRRECLITHSAYCFNGGYAEARKFSGGKSHRAKIERMNNSIHDLKRIYLRGLAE
ncbi:MAG: hypothetical protein H7301_01845 [Cryobacterium sp.]|nr:hypothetical protein [Oligoflexia bacterium]